MSLDLPRIRALCFDVDGTLSDTDDLWASRVARLLNPVGFLFQNRQPLPFARWTVMSIMTPGNFFSHILDRFDLDDNLERMIDQLARRKFNTRPSNFWILSQIPELLSALQSRYPLSIVSARDEKSTLKFLDQYNLRPYFKVIATSQTCRHTKPFPDPVLWAAEQMGVPPQECLMIGDTPVDIKAGKRAGAQTVGVLCGFGYENELRRVGADLVLNHTSDLMNILAR